MPAWRQVGILLFWKELNEKENLCDSHCGACDHSWHKHLFYLDHRLMNGYILWRRFYA